MSDKLLSAINDAIRETDELSDLPMVVAYVVLASFVDGNGERHIYSETMDDQTCHQSLGLLAFATAIENKRAVEPD